MSEVIQGTIIRVYFASPGFSAGLLDAGDDVRVKFKGAFQANVGDSVALRGRWERHAKFGRQFAVEGLCYDLPQTPEGLIRYLTGQKSFRGIGEATARKLVEHAGSGEKLDQLIRDGLDHLREELRIPWDTLKTLQSEWISRAAQNKVHAYLSSFELTPHQITTLLEKFGDGVIGVLQNDPYQLIRTVRGYGFKRVDKIARKMGVKKTHPGRIRAGILHVVHEDVKGGHTWTDGPDLVARANDVLVLDELDSRDVIRKAAAKLLQTGDLTARGRSIALPEMLEAEKVIARAFDQGAALVTPAVPDQYVDTRGLNPVQAEAYRMCLTQRLSAISGGAGTGKTHLVGRVTKIWREAGLRVVLVAPTGKAAKRIEDVLRTKHGITGVNAQTIHRLLGFDGRIFHCEEIEADALIIDEASMVDVLLMAQLLSRIDLARTQVVLVGDHNQLPPVGPGNILRDIAQHDLVPAVVLTEVVRNAGAIEHASAQILQGGLPGTCPDDDAWAVVDHFREPLHIQAYARDLVLRMIPERLGFDPIRDVQVITPIHRGPLGTREINRMMQRLLHGDVRGRFAVGDKVIQTANDYDLGVMNGTIGVIREIDRHGIRVAFDGEGEKAVDVKHQGYLQLAYCLTAHKAQGSEFPCAVVICHKSHVFADRNWLYTAVTRASKSAIVLGDRWGLRAAAKRNEVRARRTLLGQLMSPSLAAH